MEHHEELALRNAAISPTDELLAAILGEGYGTYAALQAALPSLELEQAWQWYAPHRAWLARGQHVYTTKRGTKKEKTHYWLHVYDAHFCVAVWFKEKNRGALLCADLPEQAKSRIRRAETMGKLPTFPVLLDLSADAPLSELFALLALKKELER